MTMKMMMMTVYNIVKVKWTKKIAIIKNKIV